MSTFSKAEEIYAIVDTVIDFPVWEIEEAADNVVVLHFDELIKNSAGAVVGKRRLWLQNTWRIQTSDTILGACTGMNPDPQYLEAIQHIQDKRLTEITVIERSLDTIFHFEDDLKIYVYNAHLEGPSAHAAWKFFYPQGNILQVGPGANYSIDNHSGR
ncbi:MAG: hypothetical protein DWQ07_22265 [Chloroflexi bacterium]|nr:MAG: hypothetical protein DWQ07_22265 [Chloroflexota bacterium]MBL1193873.1 hypothetical protein [Chloroflexota bacterium]NOH11167.1 hypothetical protein [Chloroflexota bacterium]